MANGNDNSLGTQVIVDDTLNTDNSVNTETDVELEVEDSFNTDSSTTTETDVELEVEDSFNDNSDNSVENEANDSFNTDSSTTTETEVDVEIEDSFNDNSVENEAEDSFNDNSDNSVDNSVENEAEDSFNTDVEIEDSFNTDNSTENEDSFNDNSDNSDNSINTDIEVELEDSFNDNTDNSVRNQDSFNITSSFNTQTLNDHSTTVGIRQYQAGFGGDFNFGLGGGAMAAGGAWGKHGAAGEMDVDLDNRVMQLDQSVNQAISTEGGNGGGNVAQVFGQNATVGFGDGSNAAGRDLSIDNSQMDLEVGDINIGNTDISTRINDSFNDYSTEMEMDLEVDIEDSYNDQSSYSELDVEIDDSFTSEVDAAFDNSLEWENSGNIFSPGAATTGGEAETEIDF